MTTAIPTNHGQPDPARIRSGGQANETPPGTKLISLQYYLDIVPLKLSMALDDLATMTSPDMDPAFKMICSDGVDYFEACRDRWAHFHQLLVEKTCGFNVMFARRINGPSRFRTILAVEPQDKTHPPEDKETDRPLYSVQGKLYRGDEIACEDLGLFIDNDLKTLENFFWLMEENLFDDIGESVPGVAWLCLAVLRAAEKTQEEVFNALEKKTGKIALLVARREHPDLLKDSIIDILHARDAAGMFSGSADQRNEHGIQPIRTANCKEVAA